MYLISLIRSGMVEQDLASGEYRIGNSARRLGFAALRGSGRQQAGQVLATEVARFYGQAVLLNAWDGNRSIIVFASEQTSALPILFRVGGVTDHWTATGKIFLAGLPRAEARRILADAGRDVGPAAMSELAAIRDAGYAVVSTINLAPGVSLSGFGSATAPVHGADGQVEFALTIIFSCDAGLDPDEVGRALSRRCRTLAGEFSSRAGC